MSNIHFLFNKSKNKIFEDSKQTWRNLIQRILNGDFELQSEYAIVEHERIYRISNQKMFCLPMKGFYRLITIRMEASLRYENFEYHRANLMISPSSNRKSLSQKRVTIVSTKKSSLSNEIHSSPKSRPSFDENLRTSSGDIRQIIQKTIRKYSNHDERISTLNRKQDLSRLSVLSISYGFGLGTKTWKNLREEKSISPSTISSLPANKIDLDLEQQENIRRMS